MERAVVFEHSICLFEGSHGKASRQEFLEEIAITSVGAMARRLDPDGRRENSRTGEREDTERFS
jgi:hypothetical protein